MTGDQDTGWKSLPKGGVLLEPGSSMKYKTGDWRNTRPVINADKCSNCLLCWIYCPDMAIEQGEKTVSINYDYCKGCGICSSVCPLKIITMEVE